MNLLGRIGPFIRDVGYAMRSMRRAPLFSLTTIASLGCGLALAVTTLVIANAYLLRAMPYPDAARLYHLRYAPPGPYEPRGMNAIDWPALKEVVEATIITAGESYYLGEGTALQFARGLRVSPGFIEGLGVRPALGTVFAAEDYRPGVPAVALIGHALWRERFNADPGIVGREVEARLENQTDNTILVRVVGVLPPDFWFGRSSNDRPDLLTPLRTVARPYTVRLREGVPVALAEQRITEAARAVGSDFRPGWSGVQLEPLQARYVAELRPFLSGISGATALVLLLVGVNVAILILLRALRRQKEMTVRVALGAGRRHLWRMLLAETGLICLTAAALGLGLTGLVLHAVAPLIEARLGKPPPGGSSAFALDWSVVAITSGAALGLAFALALVPLVSLQAKRLATGLRSVGTTATEGPGMRRLRSLLIALEIAGALVLLAGGGLMVRSLLDLVRTDLGFDSTHVARLGFVLPGTYRERAAMAQFHTTLTERLAQAGASASVNSAFPPFYELNTQPVEFDTAADAPLSLGLLPVGGGYFSTHSIPVRLGREFLATDRFDSEPVAIVSEALAQQLWPNQSALGHRLRAREVVGDHDEPGPWRTIVGVVRDVRRTYEDREVRDVYLPFLQAPTRFANLHLRTDRAALVPPTRLAAMITEIDPFVRVAELKLLSEEDQQSRRMRFIAALLTVFAVFATGLALLGASGVTAFAVLQREKEIAIRLALGADHRAVLGLFLREGAFVLTAGTALGLWGVALSGRILQNQVQGVRPFDATTLLAASLFLALCILLAIWWPARRAIKADLLQVLKSE